MKCVNMNHKQKPQTKTTKNESKKHDGIKNKEIKKMRLEYLRDGNGYDGFIGKMGG